MRACGLSEKGAPVRLCLRPMESNLPNLKRLREKHWLSIDDLGAALGFSGRSVRRWENGESDPVLSDLRKIADHFGVSVGYLIGEVDEFGRAQDRARP